MKSNNSMIWMAFLWLCCGCDNEFELHPSGLQYQFVVKKNTRTAQEGEYLMLNLTVRTADTDSVIYSTTDQETLYPYRHDSYRMQVGTDNLLDYGFQQMGLGDSVLFLLSAKDLAQASFAPSLYGLDADRSLLIMAKSVSILPYPAYRSWQKRQTERRDKQNRLAADKQMSADQALIRKLLKEQHQEHSFTPSGVGYYLEQQGTGIPGQAGDTVHIRYSIHYADGTLLPAEIGQSGPEGKSFILGKSSVLPCWDEVISLLPAGAKGQFYFPSSCTQGGAVRNGIRPAAVLVIDLELNSINRQKG